MAASTPAGDRFTVAHEEVFPRGAYVLSPATPALYEEERSTPGGGPQRICPDTGLPLWAIAVLAPAPHSGGRASTVTVTIAAPTPPVLPDEETRPLVPVVFTGLTATAHLEDGERGRASLAWSITAETVAAAPNHPGSTSTAGRGARP